MSEGVVCKLRFETTLEDGTKLFIYQVGKQYGVCTIIKGSFGCKIFDTPAGMKKYVKNKYKVIVRFSDD